MAKTLFVNGNPAQGILGTVVTAEFLNAVNKHHHTGRDVDGEGALPYAADTGAADTYVVTLSPALDECIAGMPIFFKAENANTGASTINVNGLGATAIKKNGSSDLEADDISAGQIVGVVYDDTYFQMISPAGSLPDRTDVPVRDTARNLVIGNNAANPNYQVDISADEVILEDSSGKPLRIQSLSVTADITVSGAGGLDTGGEAVSTWYHIWAVAKEDGTKSVLLSASPTAPTLPSGYTHMAYLGAIYNNASGNFITMKQMDHRVRIAETVVLSGGSATSYTSVSLSSAVPVTAKAVNGTWHIGAGSAAIYLASLSSGADCIYQMTDGQLRTEYFLPLMTSQTIYYKVSGGPGTVTVLGWEY